MADQFFDVGILPDVDAVPIRPPAVAARFVWRVALVQYAIRLLRWVLLIPAQQTNVVSPAFAHRFPLAGRRVDRGRAIAESSLSAPVCGLDSRRRAKSKRN